LDPVKIIVFVGVFVGLLVLVRIVSASSDVHASSLPQPQPSSAGPNDPGAVLPAPPEGHRRLPLTGAEFGFPFKLPAVRRLEDGTFSRPNFTDYYFSKTDLVDGPEDPSSFLDELCLKAQVPETGQAWDCNFTVTTPSGLRRIMEEEKFASLYFTGGVIVVPRWDLGEILHTAVDEIMKTYSNKELEQEQADEAARGESGAEKT
jgi:hypothetical protein